MTKLKIAAIWFVFIASSGAVISIVAPATASKALGETTVNDVKLVRITVQKKVDDSNQTLKVLESAADLGRFEVIWQAKIKTDALQKQTGKLIWNYSLRIEDSKRSTIWLLNNEGIVAPLTKTLAPAYQLKNPKEFLKFISE